MEGSIIDITDMTAEERIAAFTIMPLGHVLQNTADALGLLAGIYKRSPAHEEYARKLARLTIERALAFLDGDFVKMNRIHEQGAAIIASLPDNL